MIFEDDGYEQLPSVDDAMRGDLAVYRKEGEISHIGVIIQKVKIHQSWTIKVLSKWGKLGEYIHALADVPSVLGTYSETWSERQMA